MFKMGAPPPNPRIVDLPQGRGRRRTHRLRSIPAAGSALGLRPRIALSSAQVSTSLGQALGAAADNSLAIKADISLAYKTGHLDVLPTYGSCLWIVPMDRAYMDRA